MSSTTQNRRSSFTSSTASSLAKAKRLPSSVSLWSSSGKAKRVTTQNVAVKRAPLANLTNQRNASSSSSSSLVQGGSIKVSKTKKEAPARTSITKSTISWNKLPELKSVNSSSVVIPRANSLPRRKDAAPTVATFAVPVHSSIDVSPSKIDGRDVSDVHSIQREITSNLNISDTKEPEGDVCSREIIVELEERVDKIVNIDNIYSDTQLCATYVCDIYKHLRESEEKKRASPDFMDRIQKDINVGMRAILVDWLVEVAEEYRLVPETLYLTVNYLDRYLSGNAMNRQRLQLLGVSCMMIASKYEEICAPQVEEFCYITDNTYLKEEVLQMESAVLNYLKFEMTAPTVKCFLRRFVRAAAHDVQEIPSLQLEYLTNFIAELSLLEYSMLSYPPSLVAASVIFLARFILFPSKKPWNSTLQHYTLYRPSDLCACVKDLHRLCCSSHDSNLPAIRDKYSQHKYKCVAKKHIPPSIPREVFQIN
ncbi:cyclin-A1-4-like isoform X2 [Glycine soja]|uniref:B-like cyclin n=1 Tax=Glycine soja TaxID=3848 RepID=A0A445H5U9_GLYSO|nr:cyclin-A1-4-like isoform X2 [Glycine soja]RZB69038.1 Cyclin-A1-1 isoform B [Glycine soja]